MFDRLQRMQSRTVRDLMTEDLLTASPDDRVEATAAILIERAAGGVPVIDADGALVGMVSEVDLIAKTGSTVGSVMSRGVITSAPDDEPATVATLMALHGIRRVPVVEAGRVIGIVSRSDLLAAMLATR